MNIFITQSADVGAAKAYLLQQVLAVAARKENHQVVEHLKEADIVIVVGNMLPVNPQLMGKKVYLIGVEQAFDWPESTITDSLFMAKEYVAPAQSAVNFGDVSNQLLATGVKNIVAVTACPAGVAHTFLSAEAIETYAKKQGWNIKVETRGQVGVGNPITPEEVATADLVFVAADIDVDLNKFKGKTMYRTSTGLALKKTAQEF